MTWWTYGSYFLTAFAGVVVGYGLACLCCIAAQGNRGKPGGGG